MRLINITLSLFFIFPALLFAQGSEEVLTIENKGAGLWHNSREIQFDFISELKLDEQNGIYLATEVEEVTTDSNGNLYVCDRRDHCVKVFDETGKFVRYIGQQGQGPGELKNPTNIAISPNQKIYIADANRRISVFGLDGSFEKSYPVTDFMIIAMCISHDDRFLLCAPFPPLHHFAEKTAVPALHILQLSSNKWTRYGELPLMGRTKNGLMYAAAATIASNKMGEIFFAPVYPYKIKIYHPTGDLAKIITRKSPTIKNPEPFMITPEVEILIPRTTIKKLIMLPDNNFLVVFVDFGKSYIKNYGKGQATMAESIQKEGAVWYDVFNAEGQLLQSFPIPIDRALEMGIILHCDANSFIYTFSPAWEFPNIKKYRMKIAEKD